MARLEIQHPCPKWRHGLRPDNTVLIMARFDNTANQTGDANTVTAAMNRVWLTICSHDCCFHRSRVFRSKVKDMTDFNPTCGHALVFWNCFKCRFIMHFIRRGIKRHTFINMLGQITVKIDFPRRRHFDQILMGKNATFTALSQNHKFMGQITADRTWICFHRDRFNSKTRKCIQIGHEHFVVRLTRCRFINVKTISIFHQELTSAHHTKTWTALIAELPLNMIEHLRQIFVRAYERAEHICDHIFIRRPIEHFAFMSVSDTKHFWAISIITPRLFPQVRALNRRHQHLNRASFVLFFANNLFDFLENFMTKWEPRINARAILTDHTRAQHITVGCHSRVGRRLLEERQKIS